MYNFNNLWVTLSQITFKRTWSNLLCLCHFIMLCNSYSCGNKNFHNCQLSQIAKLSNLWQFVLLQAFVMEYSANLSEIIILSGLLNVECLEMLISVWSTFVECKIVGVWRQNKKPSVSTCLLYNGQLKHFESINLRQQS